MSLFITARSILVGSRAIAGLGYIKSRTEHLIVQQQPRGMRELLRESQGRVRREGVIWQDEEVGGRWGFLPPCVEEGRSVFSFSFCIPKPWSLASNYSQRVFLWSVLTGTRAGNSHPSSFSPQEVKALL